MIWWD